MESFDKVIIRKGRPGDAEDFSMLVSFTARELNISLFGPNVGKLMECLFRHKANYYSYEHSYFMEVDGKVAGMTLLYDYSQKNRETLRLGLLLFKYLRWDFFKIAWQLLTAGKIFGDVRRGDLYSSNSALYPEFRGRGLGERLFRFSEEKARNEGLKRIVVDVKEDNKTAISLRRKIGFRIERKLTPVKAGGKVFIYMKLVKDLAHRHGECAKLNLAPVA